jgi:Flp pilus assembly protein TadG
MGNRCMPRTNLGRAGQAVAEFALILPLMLLMMLIALDFGRLFFTYIQVNNAAREAANYAAAHAIDYANGTVTYTQFHDSAINAGLTEANVQTQAGATTPMAIASPVCFTPGSPPTTMDCASAPQNGTTASGIGNQVSVTVTQPFTFLTPLIGNFFGGTLNLSATATSTVLNPLVAQVLAPSPSPGGSAAPTAAPTAAPSAAPTAAPTAAPVFCTVPNFVGQYWLDMGSPGSTATSVWQGAGFSAAKISGTQQVTDHGAQISSQSLAAGTSLACTQSITLSDHK